MSALLADYPYPEHPLVREFWPPVDPERAGALEAELRAELAPQHPLYGLPARVLGAATGTDDVLFIVLLQDVPTLVEVHLTWNLHPEPFEGVPSQRVFASSAELFEYAASFHVQPAQTPEESMSANTGIVVDQSAPGNLRIAEVATPQPLPNEAVIRVAATSLNRGEVRMAGMGQNGRRIGWDFTGTVEKAAANGSGPQAGVRVVGMLGSGAWAEHIAAPTDAIAALPDGVSFAQAATLPVAGLTALYGLEKGGGLLGRRVLITGGTGGVGHFAIQLARVGGAHVVATARNEERAAIVRAAGAHEVVVGDDPGLLVPHGPYDLVLDGVGGPALAAAAAHLAKNGICVIYGATAGTDVSFNVRALYTTGGARLYGFILFHEFAATPAAVGLSRLAALVADGRLRPLIDVEAPVSRISELAQQLIERKFTGKAVLLF